MSFPAHVRIVDATLREGQQAPNVAFTLEERLELVRLLDEAGVGVVQAGFAGRDEETIAAIKGRGAGRSRVCALVIALDPQWERAVDRAADAGADIHEVLIRVGARQIAAMGLSIDDTLRRTEAVVRHAADRGGEVWFGPSFATLAREEDLSRLYRVAVESGATHLNIPDSTGVATPEAMGRLVRQVKQAAGPCSIGVHCHNDFGLAVANTLAGLAAGADTADVTVNGYGERAGNCPLDELVVALARLYGVDTSIRLESLTGIAAYASAVTGVPLPAAKPISGENAFAQELDIHVQLTERDASLLEPFPPETVGNRRSLRLGVGTGPAGVKLKLEELGLEPLGEDVVDRLVAEIHRRAVTTKAVGDEDFRELVAEARGRGAP